MLKHKNQLHEGANLLAFSFYRMRIKSHDRYKTRGEKEIYFLKKKKNETFIFEKSPWQQHLWFIQEEEPERKPGSPIKSLLSVLHEIFDFKKCGYTH